MHSFFPWRPAQPGVAFTTDFVVYARTKGAFAGIAVDGAALDIREKLNSAYYGKAVTPVDILVKREVSNSASSRLQEALRKIAR
jgi:lipid-binding SYLF domain-containing protein